MFGKDKENTAKSLKLAEAEYKASILQSFYENIHAELVARTELKTIVNNMTANNIDIINVIADKATEGRQRSINAALSTLCAGVSKDYLLTANARIIGLSCASIEEVDIVIRQLCLPAMFIKDKGEAKWIEIAAKAMSENPRLILLRGLQMLPRGKSTSRG